MCIRDTLAKLFFRDNKGFMYTIKDEVKLLPLITVLERRTAVKNSYTFILFVVMGHAVCYASQCCVKAIQTDL